MKNSRSGHMSSLVVLVVLAVVLASAISGVLGYSFGVVFATAVVGLITLIFFVGYAYALLHGRRMRILADEEKKRFENMTPSQKAEHFRRREEENLRKLKFNLTRFRK